MTTDGPPPVPGVVWLRDDLRVSDNPALRAAVDAGGSVVALYVLDDSPDAARPLGSASRWWLHHSLEALAASLQKRGCRLVLRAGRAEDEVADVLHVTGARNLYLNRRYSAGEAEQDHRVAGWAADHGVAVHDYTGSLLHEPGTVLTGDGRPFAVFTPFWRAARQTGQPRLPLPAPNEIDGFTQDVRSAPLDSLNLLPTQPDWSGGLAATWTPGEKGAHRRLDAFVAERLSRYADHRDEPGEEVSSRLSPHLKFGELSPYQVWHRVLRAGAGANGEKFLTELGWREFNWQLLATHPELATVNVQRRFDGFDWRTPDDGLARWQQGRTGVPLVDAGMRQLWNTGWMHNRVRMVVASYLVKNLRFDWRLGEQWFWDTLVDADPANNPSQWQWVAGSGADAAPFFRVFNPVTQGRKFDAQGDYIRTWVPELREREGDALQEPWNSDGEADGYPAPLVDLKRSRQEALDAYDKVRG